MAIDSQKFLPNTKINFQCCTENSLLDFILDKNQLEGDISFLSELSNIIDDQILSLLVDDSQISINTKLFEEFSNDKHFNCLFQPRQFMKSTKNNCKNTVTKLSQEELFADVKNKKFLLISDIEGTGKSYFRNSQTLSNLLCILCRVKAIYWYFSIKK